MPIYKDEQKGTWYVSVRYKNWKGENARKLKRGFRTKKECSEPYKLDQVKLERLMGFLL